jgi:predicted MFS family arabinose efflux permease
MLGVYTIVGPAADRGWGDPRTLALGAGSALLLAGFGLRESRASSPLMPLRLLRSRVLLASNAIQILSVAGMFGMFFLGSLYLRRVLGYDPLQIGLAFLPVCVAMGLLSVRYSERIVMRLGARSTLLSGLPLIALGLIWFARVPVHGHYVVDVLPAMALLGIGAGISFPALMNAAMSGAKPEDAGLASGLVNTTAQVGGALGLAVLATLAASHTRVAAHGGASTAAALTSGYHLAFWIAAALVTGAVAVSAIALRAGAVGAGVAAEEEAESREDVEQSLQTRAA